LAADAGFNPRLFLFFNGLTFASISVAITLFLGMDLYIMRHGIAKEASASGRDRDRVLTEEGIDRTRETGKALRKLGIEFDAILSSPFARAWQTAELVAIELNSKKTMRPLDALGAESTAASAARILAAETARSSSALVVGHEPILSELISLLLSGSAGLAIAMKKGAICKLTCIRPEPGGCRLDWLLSSKHLSRIA
jgi:phosphohistidine phosphatase